MTDAPTLNRNSAQSTFSSIPRLGLMELRDGAYYPTESGMALLDGEPPGEVITPVLISKVFSVAYILNELRNADGRLPATDVAERLQSYYPNWTTTFAPTSLLQWLQALKLIETKTANGRRELLLTDTGFEWAASVPNDMSAWRVGRAELSPGSANADPLETERDPAPQCSRMATGGQPARTDSCCYRAGRVHSLPL